jgi:hypothetical protein
MSSRRQLRRVFRTGPLLDRLNDTWRFALLGGLLAAPLVALGYWQTGSELSLSPVLLAGLVAGYLARRDTGETRIAAGVRAGLVGALPTLWLLVDVAGAATALDGPTWFLVVGGGFAIAAVATVALLAFGLAGLLGGLGAVAGGWLAARRRGDEPPAASV